MKPTRASRRARNFVSFVRDQNLYVIDLATGKERAVTREGGGLVSFGMAEFIAQEEMDRDTGYWWSPDERHIALDARRRVARSPRSSASRSRPPAPPSCASAIRPPARAMRAWTCSSRTWRPRAALQLDLGRRADIYLPRRRLVSRQPRHRRAAPEPRPENPGAAALRRRQSGRGRVLLTERSEHWVPLHRELTFLQRRQQFIWASSRDGYPAPLPVRQRRQADPAAHARANSWWSANRREPAIRAVDERARPCVFHRQPPLAGRAAAVLGVAGRAGRAAARDRRRRAGTASPCRRTRGCSSTRSRTPTRRRSVTLRRANGAVLTVLVPNELDAHASVRRASSTNTCAPEFGTHRRRRRADDAVQTAEAARARSRANDTRCWSMCTAAPACSA